MSESTRLADLAANYSHVLENVHKLNPKARLVAVSKYKPASDIQALYDIGVRDFGENYVQELIEKVQTLPKDIRWHFIGALQTGKCNVLLRDIPNLFAVQTVDLLKKCTKLNSSRSSIEGSKVINVYLQVNTSGETQKAGFSYENVPDLEKTVEYLLKEATHLKLLGLMTIGSVTESQSEQENADFARLVLLKLQLDLKYDIDLELSMGMSSDYVDAINQGSTCVRVGSSIFGSRITKEEAKEQKIGN